MPLLSITKTYADAQILSESDLDNILNDVENFLNVTKIDSTNIQADGVATSNIADNAITAAKLDETDDYEMETLLLGDATGPTLSKVASARLLVADEVQIGTSDGPILSRAGTGQLQLGSGAGPILEASGSDLLLTSNNLILNSSDVTLSREASGVLGLQGVSDLRLNNNARLRDNGNESLSLANDGGTTRGNLVVSHTGGTRLKIIRGTITTNPSTGATVEGEGFSSAHPGTGTYTITFSTAFADTPSIAMSKGSFNGNAFLNVTSETASSFTIEVRNGSGTLIDGSPSPSKAHFIAIGPYA